MIVEKINQYLYEKNLGLDEALRYEVEKLAGWIFRRQFMSAKEDKPGVIRISSLGKCPRQQAYKYHGIEAKGKEIDGRGRINFFMGDLAELLVTQLAKLAGARIVATGFNQLVVELKVGDTSLKGHPDGVVFCDDKKQRLFECKSFPSYSFEKFEKRDINEGYLVQINCYMETLGLDECVLVGFNKNNGILGEQIFKKEEKYINIARDNYRFVAFSTPDMLPARPYHADKNGFYSWKCLYCSHWGVCLPNAEKVLVRKSYKLKEKPCTSSISV